MEFDSIRTTGPSEAAANAANTDFDSAMRAFLREWLHQAQKKGAPVPYEGTSEDFIEGAALRAFITTEDKPLERILAVPALRNHLLRPVSEVRFPHDYYEPQWAHFERRVYNLAERHLQTSIPFRYTRNERANAFGDRVFKYAHSGERHWEVEDIGKYFGTRRSDKTALRQMGSMLQKEASAAESAVPLHIITEEFLEDSMRRVRTETERLQAEGDTRLHCFVIQSRQAPKTPHEDADMHLAAALFVMDPANPATPVRALFCDTVALPEHMSPPWWGKFCDKADRVFASAEGYPLPEGEAVSRRALETGVRLQRLHNHIPTAHHDIDCAFYTSSMARALIQVVQQNPETILHGTHAEIKTAMTARMPEYFAAPNQPFSPEQVREQNIIARWNSGREALLALAPERMQAKTGFLPSQDKPKYVPTRKKQGWAVRVSPPDKNPVMAI